jgi:hypothetical protein
MALPDRARIGPLKCLRLDPALRERGYESERSQVPREALSVAGIYERLHDVGKVAVSWLVVSTPQMATTTWAPSRARCCSGTCVCSKPDLAPCAPRSGAHVLRRCAGGL